MNIEFHKYEGAGNDFVMIDNRSGKFAAAVETVARLCDRRFGVGADGLILLEKADDAAFSMRYFNADGREATMCGNGGRCIALFAHHLGVAGSDMEFRAMDGLHTARVIDAQENTGIVSLGMSDVETIERAGNGFRLDTGSPHYVEFVKDVDAVDVVARGRELRRDPRFAPGGVNVNFVEVMPDGTLRVRTYERGVEDETLACGTGAVASALTADVAYPPVVSRRLVQVLGGMLDVEYENMGEGRYVNIRLTGSARRVFSGSFEIKNF